MMSWQSVTLPEDLTLPRIRKGPVRFTAREDLTASDSGIFSGGERGAW